MVSYTSQNAFHQATMYGPKARCGDVYTQKAMHKQLVAAIKPWNYVSLSMFHQIMHELAGL